MASVLNKWVGYLDRSYEQIKATCLSKLTLSNPELTDHSESNPFIILLEIFAGISEVLNYYLDNLAQESYLATAQRRSSVISHVKALDYRIKARSPEQVDLTINWAIAVPSQFTLSAGFSIESNDGIKYLLLTDQIIPAGVNSSVIPIHQVTEVDQPNYATTSGLKNQAISLGTTYVHKSSQVFINSLEYFEQDTFAYSLPTDRHYIVEIEADGNAYIVLGDGKRGFKPTASLTIGVKFNTTLGPDGKVGMGNFKHTTIVLNSSLPGGLTISSANTLLASASGTYYEDSDSIKKNAIARIRTNDRMVTPLDHEDIIKSVPGVKKAKHKFCCGKTIDIYIVPEGGGVANSSLLSLAQAKADDTKMVATFPNVLPAGETGLYLAATVTAKKRKSLIDTKAQVEAALLEFGSIDNQEINGAIRLSDIQALIDNLDNVDFVDISSLYTLPYARPILHNNNLAWTNKTKVNSVSIVKWRLEYDGTNFRIFKDGNFLANIGIGATFIDPDNAFEFTISAGSYALGNAWEFNTYPFFKNIQLTDYTIFSIKSNQLAITVNAASNLNSTNC